MPPALSELFTKVLSKKKSVSYSPVFKEFACTLQFYSTAAYNYVRNNFCNALPAPATIRRWCARIDLRPSIHKPVLDCLKNMIEKEGANDKELQFGIQLDEMLIKKPIDGMELLTQDFRTIRTNLLTKSLMLWEQC